MRHAACRKCGGELRDGVAPNGHKLRWCPACHARAKRLWKSSHPGAERAHRLVARALARGTLRREPCVICGDPKSEAHHPDGDYSRPLTVEWRCRVHHRAAHRRGA
jgi:hypothetical protein